MAQMTRDAEDAEFDPVARSAPGSPWRDPAFPKAGWRCIDIEDLGEPAEVCEACLAQEIRYVHTLRHPGWPKPMRCGCVCAGRLEGDLAGAKEREAERRKLTARRQSWPTLKGWKTSRKGNAWIKKDGWICTIYRRGSNWAGTVKSETREYERSANKTYGTEIEAKLAAFDAIQAIIAKGLHLEAPRRRDGTGTLWS